MTVRPYTQRLVCDICRRVLMDGYGPSGESRCEYCAQREEQRRAKREAIKADPFHGLREEDGGE